MYLHNLNASRIIRTIIVAQLGCSFTLYGEEVSDSVPQQNLGEVIVTGNAVSRRIADARLGAENIELSKMSLTPVLFGENDIIKSITLLPGVNSEGEGAGGYEVRGGTAAQNHIMIDGISLFNPAHVMGIFSTFNEDALARATLYKGPVPPAYGGASSSVLDIGLDSGDPDSFQGAFTVGILAAKLKASGPIADDKFTFAVSARRSYVDMFLKMVPKYRDIVMNFYDITAKVRYNPSSGNYIDVSFFGARDNMSIDNVMGMRWGNIGGSLSWMTRTGYRWHFITTAAVTSYTATMDMRIMKSSHKLDEFIRSFSINERVRFRINDSHELDGGVRSELLHVKSGEMLMNNSNDKEVKAGWQNALWIDYTGMFGDRITATGGFRLSAITAMTCKCLNEFKSSFGSDESLSEKTYVIPEPRISIKYAITDFHNLKAGFSSNSQPLHAIRSSSTSFPFDRYAVTSGRIKPEKSEQISVGYAGTTPTGMWEWSAEGYYRSIRNVYDYRDGQTMFSDIALENLVLCGKGKSYGLELMFRKNFGRLTGWVSYTLSKTLTLIPGINNDEWYDATNDRRHSVSVISILNISDKWNISANWQYSSGHPLTLPDAKYDLDGATCYYYSGRNGYRTPSTHHLDISATYKHVGQRITYQWVIGIYNLYNRYNPYIIFFEDDATKPSGTRAVQRSLYGIVPSISYTLKF